MIPIQQLLEQVQIEYDEGCDRARNEAAAATASEKSKATAWDQVFSTVALLGGPTTSTGGSLADAVCDYIRALPQLAFRDGQQDAKNGNAYVNANDLAIAMNNALGLYGYRVLNESNADWLKRLTSLIKSQAQLAFETGQQDAKNKLLRNVGVPPEVSLAPAKGFTAPAGAVVDTQPLNLGTIKLSSNPASTSADPPPTKDVMTTHPFVIVSRELEAANRFAKELEAVIADQKYQLELLRADIKHLRDFKDRSLDADMQEQKLLKSVGLYVDWGDFGDGPPHVRASPAPRNDVRYEKADGATLHYNGIPCYVHGLIGTHPENWKLIRDGGK